MKQINKTKMNSQALNIGQQMDWKFGLITRTVTRVDEDEYQIDDTSGSWQSAFVSGEELNQLTKGDIQLIDLHWE